MAFTGDEGEKFPLDTAAAWTANYRKQNPNGIKAHFFGRNILLNMLKQADCVGLRMYYALDEKGVQQMIVVGADANENDLYNGIVAERGMPCEPYCDSGKSPLV